MDDAPGQPAARDGGSVPPPSAASAHVAAQAPAATRGGGPTVLMARVALYGLALVLIAVWWHQHRAQADDGDWTRVPRAAAPAAPGSPDANAFERPTRVGRTRLLGHTSHGGRAEATLEDGRLVFFRGWSRLSCPGIRPPAPAGLFWIAQDRFSQGAGRAYASVMPGTPYTWRGHPRATYAFDLDATVSPRALRGTFTVEVAAEGGAQRGSCRSGPVGFTLRSAG